MSSIKLHELPADILIHIIQKLNLHDVRSLILTCKTLQNIIGKYNVIWKDVCRNEFLINGKLNKFSQLWYERCRISRNWCQGRFRIVECIHNHQNFMPWLKYDNATVLLLSTGSNVTCYKVNTEGLLRLGSHLKLWYISMPKIRRFDKRSDDISRFVLRDNLLACGNRNGSAVVYAIDNIYDIPHEKWLMDHCMLNGSVEVSTIDICNNKTNIIVAMGSIDSSSVHLWKTSDQIRNLSLYKCKDLVGVEGVKCVSISETRDLLAIGPDGNSKPYLLDLNASEVVMSAELFANENEVIQDIQWHDQNTLCYVSHAGVLEMVDIRTRQVVYHVEDPFQAAFYCMKTDGRNAIIAGSSQHGRCVLYDIRKPYHRQLYFTMLKSRSTPVYSLDFDSTKLIVAGDQRVNALDFNVASFSPSKDYSHVYR